MAARDPLLNLILVELSKQGFKHSIKNRKITIELSVSEQSLKICVEIPNDFPLSLPDFSLLDRLKMGRIAHVPWLEDNPDYGDICYTHKTAVNINTQNPVTVFMQAFESAISTLQESLANPIHNEAELYREYMSVWFSSCHKGNPVFNLANPKKNDYVFLTIYNEKNNSFISKAAHSSLNLNTDFTSKKQGQDAPIGKGLLISLPQLTPPPGPGDNMMKWWKTQLNEIPVELLERMRKKYTQVRARNFWVILHSEHNENPIYIGLRFEVPENLNKASLTLPILQADLKKWNVSATLIRPLVPDVLIPRGGSNGSWQDKHICVVGCGSVGSKVIDLCCSQGAGQLTIIDHDFFSLENLHKHQLSSEHLGKHKATSLKDVFEKKYIFCKIDAKTKPINGIAFDESNDWSKYDLIVWVTGNTTLEMAFDRYRQERSFQTPVIYAWNEPFGIGGHAIITIPNKSGCLACTYIDKETLAPTLYSNLGFIAPGQKTMSDIGGCGYDYIAFSNTDATQTAILVSRLAEKLFNDRIYSPSTLSWKGDDYLALQKNLKLTRRYKKFEGAIKMNPINHEDCHVCN